MPFDVEDWQLDDDAVSPVPSLESPALAPIDVGAVAVPGNPSVAFDQPEFGPPAPDPTDQIAATLPPAPGNITTGDPSKQFAPAVPNGAPGMVPVGAAGQGANQPTAGTPEDPNGINQALQDVGAARAESDEAKKRQFEGQQLSDLDRADAATKRREELERRQTEDQQNAALDKAANDKAQAQLAQTDEALKGFRFKDLFADKSSAQQVATALSAALLAIGAGMMKTPKYAIEILDKKRAEDHQKQLEHLNLLKDDFARATGNVQLADKLAAKRYADINLGRARKDELLAAQFDEVAARTKEGNGATDALAYSAKLKQEGAQAKLEALTTLQKLHRQSELDDLNEEYKRSQIANQKSLAALHDRGVGQGRKAHGAGGSGGGGRSDALGTFISAAQDGKTSDAEVAKLGSAAGLKPNQIGAEILKYRTEGDKEKAAHGAAGRADLMGDRLLESKVKNFASEHQLPKLEAAHRKLEEVRSMLDSGNPVAAMSALMEYDAAAKGSSATESSMHAIQGRLGGTWDRLKGAIQKGATGGFGETETKNLRGAIDAGIQSFKDSVEPIHKAFGEKFDYGQPGVKQAAAGVFRPFGYHAEGTAPNGGESGGAAPGGKRVKLKDGRVGTLEADGTFHEGK